MHSAACGSPTLQTVHAITSWPVLKQSAFVTWHVALAVHGPSSLPKAPPDAPPSLQMSSKRVQVRATSPHGLFVQNPRESRGNRVLHTDVRSGERALTITGRAASGLGRVGWTDLGLDPPHRGLPAYAGRHVPQLPDCARRSKRPLPRIRGVQACWGGATSLSGAQDRHHIVYSTKGSVIFMSLQ